MKRYLRLYRIMIIQFFKQLMQSKVDFILGLCGFFFSQIAGIIFLYLVFEQIPDLKGWTLAQLIFIYGFAQIPRGIDHLFTDNIWLVAWRLVRNGDFDRYMLRPMNVLFQVIAEKLQPDAFGELIIGIILLVNSLKKGILIVDGMHIAMFIVSIFAGAVIYTSIKLFYASIAFWTKTSGPFLQFAYEMSNFAKYPTEIYGRGVRFVITFLVPFAFVAYLPAAYFLKPEAGPVNIFIECAIAFVLWFVSYGFFNYGLKKYESAGN